MEPISPGTKCSTPMTYTTLSGERSEGTCPAPATHRSESGSPICRQHAESLYGANSLPQMPVYDSAGPGYRESVKPMIDKLVKITQSHPLPDGVTIENSGKDFYGEDNPKIYARSNNKTHGELSWSPETGFVNYVEADHPVILAHMMLHAHMWAQARGQMGPTHSDTVTTSGMKLVKGFGSAFAPEKVRRY